MSRSGSKKSSTTLRQLRPPREQYTRGAKPLARSIDIGGDLDDPDDVPTDAWSRPVKTDNPLHDLQASIARDIRISIDCGIPYEDMNHDVLNGKIEAICVAEPTIQNMVDRLDSNAEEKQKWYEDSDTPQGKVLDTFLIRPNLRAEKEKIVETAEQSIDILDVLTEQPYSEAALEAHEIYSIIIFAVSLSVAIWDLVVEFQFLPFKFTELGLSLFDFLFMLFTLAPLMKRYRCFKDDKQAVKHLIYLQNIVGEILLYPLLIFSVLGIAVEGAYKYSGLLHGFSMTLVAFESIDLMWTYIERLIIIRKATSNIESKIYSRFKNKAGYVLSRSFCAVIGNGILFAVMLAMLFRRVEYDNKESADYTISVQSAFFIGSTLIFPVTSFMSFALSNLHWLYEALIQITLLARRNNKILDEIEEKTDEKVTLTLNVFMAKIEASKSLMHQYVDAKWYQKLLTPYTAWYFHFVLFMWAALFGGQMLVTVAHLSGDSLEGIDLYLAIAFCTLAVIINCQTFILLIFLPIFALIYLFSLIVWALSKCCCKGQKFTTSLIKGKKVMAEEEDSESEDTTAHKAPPDIKSPALQIVSDFRSVSVPLPNHPHTIQSIKRLKSAPIAKDQIPAHIPKALSPFQVEIEANTPDPMPIRHIPSDRALYGQPGLSSKGWQKDTHISEQSPKGDLPPKISVSGLLLEQQPIHDAKGWKAARKQELDKTAGEGKVKKWAERSDSRSSIRSSDSPSPLTRERLIHIMDF